MNYDGSINIDTRIDTKGMKKGTNAIGNALSGVLRAVGRIGAVLASVFSAGAIFAFVKTAVDQFGLLSDNVGGKVGEMKKSFETFKGALAGTVAVALEALAPYIIIVVNWFTKLLNIITAVIQSLFGVSAQMNNTAEAAADTAKETKKAAGALASFDQLNVLSSGGDAATGGKAAAPAVPIPTVDPSLLAKVEDFKNKLLNFFEPVIDALKNLKEALTPLGETIWAGLKWAWDNILVPLGNWVITDLLPVFLEGVANAADLLNESLLALQPYWEWFLDNVLKPAAEWTGQIFIDALTWINEKLAELAQWVRDNPEKIQAFFDMVGKGAIIFFQIVGAVAAFVAIVIVLAAILLVLLSPIGLIIVSFLAFISIVYLLYKAFTTIRDYIPQVIEQIKTKIANIATWFEANVTEPLSSGFSNALEGIKNTFVNIFEWIQDFIGGVVNSIIDTINGMIESVIGGINEIIGGVNTVGGAVGAQALPTLSAPQIPRLATGAVIPANSQFLAVLGDQRSGRNLEAPEGLIRQIVREESGSRAVSIRFEGSLAPLIRELKPLIDQENNRVGGSLLSGGVI